MISRSVALIAEVNELEKILSQIPADEVIERSSFEGRLLVARKLLAALPQESTGDKARLTFRGRPVLGSHGISADFGSKAAGAFSDAFAAVVAGLNDSLSSMGPIPDRAKNQLLITGTAMGSFGFEFELPSPSPAPDLFTDHAKGTDALEKIRALLQVSAVGSDDEVAEIIEVIHPRAVKKISEFLAYLAQQQAWCGLEFKEKFFLFESLDQLQFSTDRLQESNIQERRESYIGEFQGVLPSSRTFEFRIADQPAVIKGKVDPSIGDPDLLNREWLHKQVSVELDVFQVGQGRPRFALHALSDIKALAN